MGSIPLINMVGVIHLCFVAAFIGLYLCEAVIEGYAARRTEFHPSAIRYHYLVDIFVELPLMSGVLITGIILAILAEKLTALHLILIACGSIAVLFCPYCFFRFVRTRERLLSDGEADEETLVRIRRRMGILTLAVFNPLLLTALVVGFWLARNRLLDSIYG